MANYGPSSAWLRVGGYDVTADSFTLEGTNEQLVEERHPIGTTGSWETHSAVGVGKVGLVTQGGPYSDQAMLSAFQSMGTTLQTVTYGTDGLAFAANAALLNGTYVSQWKRAPSRTALTKAQGIHTITGAYYRGQVVGFGTFSAPGDTKASYLDGNNDRFPAAVAIATSNASSQVITSSPHGLTSGDVVVVTGHSGSTPSINGQQTVDAVVDSVTFTMVGVTITVGGTGGTVKRCTAHGAVANLHVTALTLGGYTDVAFKLQHSDDHSVWTDVTGGAFSTVAAVGGQQLTIAVATTVKRYVALLYSFDGAGAGPSVTYVAAVARL